MKILKSKSEIPNQITYKGRIYKYGPDYGNLETARREARYLRAYGNGVIIRKHYIQPPRPYTLYCLYIRMVK